MTEGAQIACVQASCPLARLSATSDRPDLTVRVLGIYSFTPEQVSAVERMPTGPSAQLSLKSFDDQLPTFVVREKVGDQVTTTDVSNYLSVQDAGEVTAQNGKVSYAACFFPLNNQEGTSFSVSGFLSLYRGTIQSPGVGPLMRVDNAGGQVAGPGSVGGNEAVFRGPLAAGFPVAEVNQ